MKKNNNNWYFGNKAGLNFNTNPPTVLYDGALNTREGCSAVSDKNSGHLLFYTDGATVWDSTHHSMPNGTGLLGRYDSEQGAIVPFPGHVNQYYIFTTTYFYGLYYSVVDMALNSGKGDVMVGKKNINLLAGNVASDKVTYTRHANKRDYWVVAKESYSNVFYIYLLDINGLHTFDTISIGSPDFAFPQLGGVLKFNRNSNLLINCQAHHDDPLNKSRLQCFGFNATTGQITNVHFTVDSITYPYGAEFSIDNKKLYVSSPFSKKITQYDLEAVNVKNSAIDIFTSNTIVPGQLQMGPDNKIYVPYNNGNYAGSYRYIGVINNPNSTGNQCGFIKDAIDLFPNSSFLGLPQAVYEYQPAVINGCANVDTFNCKSLTFELDSSRFCVPILLSADSASFANNGFHFCVTYDTTFVKPTGVYSYPTDDTNYIVSIDSQINGKLCVNISYVQQVVMTGDHKIDIGCLQFVLNQDPFTFDAVNQKVFDYLSFGIVGGCNTDTQKIHAWFTENNSFWATEDGHYWKLEE
ncbi:MAG: hypothetical protein IPM95_06790 [Sphingobacteriales bacterium]|nr:hypothetical protein [Sphingobacteriales bacterium]